MSLIMFYFVNKLLLWSGEKIQYNFILLFYRNIPLWIPYGCLVFLRPCDPNNSEAPPIFPYNYFFLMRGVPS